MRVRVAAAARSLHQGLPAATQRADLGRVRLDLLAAHVAADERRPQRLGDESSPGYGRSMTGTGHQGMMLNGRRRRLLNYLRRNDVQRYRNLIERLGLRR